MRTTTRAALALPGTALLILAGAAGASAEESYDMRLTDTMGNDSGSSSTAQLTVDGDTLKLCLATKGGPRPTEFVAKKGTDHLLIVLRRGGAKPAGDRPAEKAAGKRTFRMGFTGFVHDITPEAVAASRKFCRENGDLLAHHIEGVPWAEALGDKPFPKALLDEHPRPTDHEIREFLSGNFCRCAGYNLILNAVRDAAGLRTEKR